MDDPNAPEPIGLGWEVPPIFCDHWPHTRIMDAWVRLPDDQISGYRLVPAPAEALRWHFQTIQDWTFSKLSLYTLMNHGVEIELADVVWEIVPCPVCYYEENA